MGQVSKTSGSNQFGYPVQVEEGRMAYVGAAVIVGDNGERSGSPANPLYVADALSSNVRVPKGYQQITNTMLTTVMSLTPPAGATMALIQNNGVQPVRYRDDGVDPTASTGHRITTDDILSYSGNLGALRLVRETDGVVLDILYYG